MSRLFVLFGTLALACAAPDPAPADAGVPDEPFAYLVIADPHLVGTGGNAPRLEQLVAWINEVAAEERIELVFVLGDVGWGSGLVPAREILDRLSVPYLPLIGDNEVVEGAQEEFDEVFASHYGKLASVLENFTRAPLPVVRPGVDEPAWLQNFSFDHRGVHFVALDVAARGIAGLKSEIGYIHDFEGGTWRWLEEDLATRSRAERDSVVLFSHIPLHDAAFHLEELERVRATFAPYRERLWANFAGHVHISYETSLDDLIEVYVTAATWANELSHRLVRVERTADGFEHTQALVGVPFP